MALSAVKMAKTFSYISRLFRLADSAACKKAKLYSSMSQKARRAFRQRTFDQSKRNQDRVLLSEKGLRTLLNCSGASPDIATADRSASVVPMSAHPADSSFFRLSPIRSEER